MRDNNSYFRPLGFRVVCFIAINNQNSLTMRIRKRENVTSKIKILKNNIQILVFKYSSQRRIEIFEEIADPIARKEMYKMSLKYLIQKIRYYQKLLLGLCHSIQEPTSKSSSSL